MKNILIADDHPIVRAGLKQIINDEENFTVTGEASNGPEVIKLINNNSYDLLVLDISMPGESGLDVLKQLQYSNPDLKVLILSTYSEEIYAERSIKAGASGYLNKQYATRDLILAIKKILRGDRYLSTVAAENIALNKTNNHDLPHKILSDREFQVLTLIGKGKTVSAISTELLLSVKTISTYRKRVLEKMNLKTTTELIKYTIDKKLV